MAEAAVVGLVPEIEALSAEAARVAALDPGELADAELSSALVELQVVLSRLSGAQARMAATFDARRGWAPSGARSCGAWLAYKTRIPMEAGRAIVRLGRALRAMPATEAALLAGSLGVAHARRLARAAHRAPDLFARDEEMLVGHARAMRFSYFARTVAYWEQRADPDGAERDAKELYESRSLHLSQTFGDAWALDGTGDPVGGTIVHGALSAIEGELFEADWREAKARIGEGVSVSDLARTPAQRRFDALVEMATRAMTAPKDGKRPRPLFTAVVGYPEPFTRMCQLANGMVVTPGSLVPWMSEADVERVVFDARSRVVDVSARSRLFTGATRRAVEVRDLHCRGFACDVPADQCEVDHVEPYADGGLTTVDNGRLLCRQHHRQRRPPPRQTSGGGDPA